MTLSQALISLSDEARRCRRCPGMRAGTSVLGSANGPASTPVMFVAEAPGYLGAVRSGVPLQGDRSGDNFDRYCGLAGIDRAAVFVTNAVLCHPPGPRGGNRTPGAGEVAACSRFLRRQIELVDPSLVVALGRVALDALARIAPHGLRFGRDAGRIEPWGKRHIMSLYHPSGQTMGRRSRAQQSADYGTVAAWLSER